jgi:hypothetical protein
MQRVARLTLHTEERYDRQNFMKDLHVYGENFNHQIMSNTNLISRIKLIHSCLSSDTKVFWSLDDLADAIAKKDIIVSRRTIERDVKMMRYDERLGYFAPIEYCRKNKGHYYSDRSYSMPSFENSNGDVIEVLTVLTAVIDHCNEYINQSLKKVDDQVAVADEYYGILVMQAVSLMNDLQAMISNQQSSDSSVSC